MNDLAIAWRDEQIGMLKAEVQRLQGRLEIEIERAEAAEERYANLKEEIESCRATA